MKLKLCLLILYSLYLFGCPFIQSEEAMTIQSGEVEYNGKEISLVGQVVIQHELGQISAHHLTIIPSSEKDKKNKFSFLKMKEEVVVDSKDGGSLCCQEAEIDYANLTGLFLGNIQQPDVVYTHQSLTQDAKPPFLVKSLEMQAELVRHYDSVKQTYKSSIHQIQARHQVRAYYNQEYVGVADRALYQRQPERDVLFLYADEPNSVCQVTNQNGDQLRASQVMIDVTNRHMWMDHPHGFIHINQGGQLQPIHFSAPELVWNDAEHCLILPQGAYMKQAGLGEIKTNREIHLYQRLINGKKEFYSLVAQADTQLIYKDETSQTSHHIFCQGPLIVDHDHLQVLMHSPTDEQGQVLNGKQIYFEDEAGDLYADHLYVQYERKERTLEPIKLTMQGHVQILSRFDGHWQESGSVLQYALADLVEYFPKEKEMILSGQQERRVLLFDKINHLQMSAPSLRIRQEGQSHKRSIKGIGDVRFTFIEHEFDEIKKHFNLDEKTH